MAFFSFSFYLPRTLLTLRVEPWRIALTPAPAARRDAPSLTAGRPAVPSCDECPRGVATCWDTLHAETVLWRCDWNWLFCGHCDWKWLFCCRWEDCCTMGVCSVALRILRTESLSCHLRDDGKWEVLGLGFADFSFVLYSYQQKQIFRRSGKLRSGLAQQEGSSRFMSSGMWRCDVRNHSRNRTASHFRRLEASAAALWERKLLTGAAG